MASLMQTHRYRSEPPARSQRGSRGASKPGEARKPKRWVAHVFPSRHDRRHDAVWPGRVSLNADLTTVIVAVLGAAGTLSAPLLTQRIAARTRQQEYELQRDQRREDAAEGQRKEAFSERRTVYAKLNTAARQYTQELRN